MTTPSRLLLVFLLVSSSIAHAGPVLVRSNQPLAHILTADQPSPVEQYAAQELQQFVLRWSNALLPIGQTQPDLPIILGTPASNPLVEAAYQEGVLALPDELGSEGYELHVTEDQVYVAAHGPQGVLYGVYALLEVLIGQITGLQPADLDFVVPVTDTIELPLLHRREAPFYPLRSTLESEDPDWLARHRVNMSGAEGVWSGTGYDDGLGTAFQYVDATRFDSYQDQSVGRRQATIRELRQRFEAFQARGIRPYLFMYVTGEPTKALAANHPEYLAPAVPYGGSRNLASYRPFCWTNPDVHALFRDLIQEILRTYPNLGGLHLRSWGWETRAPDQPACEGEDPQEQLWRIYQIITQAALEVRPDFRFYVSGYNRSWLKDPDGGHLAQMPPGTIISQKWGLDGEPTPDPGIPLEQLQQIGEAGAQLMVLSHDTEEAMPLWMLEGDLFAQGLRQYAYQPARQGLGGFTIQGQDGFSHLDKILSARLAWEPQLDYESLMLHYLRSHLGEAAGEHALKALQLHSWTLASFFRDYAYSLSVTGWYGSGSSGAATRFWQLVGPVPMQDMLSIADLPIAEKAVERFAALLPQQQMAVNEMETALRLAQPATDQDEGELADAVAQMNIWLNLFESRLQIAEAIQLGFDGGTVSEIHQRLASAQQYSRTMLTYLPQIQHFVHVFGYEDEYYRLSLTEEVQGEIELLDGYDAAQLLRPEEITNARLQIEHMLNHPNPLDGPGTTFIYDLSRAADEVTLTIYTVAGRQLWQTYYAPTDHGRNEFFWDGRDQADELLGNGVYLYRLIATTPEQRATRVGKLAVLR